MDRNKMTEGKSLANARCEMHLANTNLHVTTKHKNGTSKRRGILFKRRRIFHL